MSAQIQWEYHVEKFNNWRGNKPEDVEAALNAMGMDGWEVISSQSSPEGAIWVTAKRPLTSAVMRARKADQ
jgi:hypothetical protein